MVERRHQEVGDNSPEWELSPENVTGLFEEWPVAKNEAFSALEEKTNIAKSWYMRLSTTLIDLGVIEEAGEPKIGAKIPKKLDAKSLFKVALLAQALKDQGLLFIECPQRVYTIKEIAEVMRLEPNLC